MAEVFRRDPKPVVKPPEVQPVIRRTAVEDHSPLDVLSSAARKPREAYTTVAKADRDMVTLTNREKYDNPANPVGRRFQEFVEKMNV